MADYTLLKNPQALSTVEQLQISMFVTRAHIPVESLGAGEILA